MTGVHTGDMPGLPATGRSFRIVGDGVGEVRDGQIVHVTDYWNMADFLGQVGALPPRPG
jgi:ketosteroid isomerase-like protein